ncbi:hypothetical protein SSBR45G_12780 [Bradyrhizobium sp. SSBR45G]|uniref:hypothetical protein n=1 Tax=unclassified Bradyrhizobium TaxID=2631580 RepID=UPI0023429F91|nr:MULTISPECIES: hypothetical protein [unclassified Bradyrhizobium]GLH76370.1 hypothetical protein SSBR45G_12780 [Bradyrhizobium sp. SSBR45G]GLH83146.1 hypothetical protein SSBR45R_06060 [Bradyrhizobium sp. SSBR45R]
MSGDLLRFVLQQPHPDTGVDEGIFRAAYGLQKNPKTSSQDRKELDVVLSWLGANLAVPRRFNRSKSKGFYRRRTAGVSWLKSTAYEHVSKMRELSAILERNGIGVSQIRTDRPGYLVFEDEHQVVAEPFRSEPLVRKQAVRKRLT